MSKIIKESKYIRGDRGGTPLYLAPEIIKKLPYDFKVDNWAIGCVLYLLTNFEAPFSGENMLALGFRIVHRQPKSMPNSYSQKLNNFILNFLDKNPKCRPRLDIIEEYFPENIVATL